MKEELIKRIANLLKIKSIVTIFFMVIIAISIAHKFNLPDWLIALISLALKELFDKDKIQNANSNEKGE